MATMNNEQNAWALADVVSRIRDVSPRLGARLDAELTVLQRDVLAAMNQGEPAAAIAQRLAVSQPTVEAEWFRGNRAIEDFVVTTADPEGVIDSMLNGQTALRQARTQAQGNGQAQTQNGQAQRAEALLVETPGKAGTPGGNHVQRLGPERRANAARAALQAVREDLQRERPSLPHGV